jgi:hypothetical protein
MTNLHTSCGSAAAATDEDCGATAAAADGVGGAAHAGTPKAMAAKVMILTIFCSVWFVQKVLSVMLAEDYYSAAHDSWRML